ncbi:uncharacterized protein Triagg1_4997 [Trichoderma aggressivum f. europaeum]|uniref:DRBM domain-containing protein n=1 Tax=Trichoderma aggressivum f. europaeum TaxID=173218 RepID=A0AAE1IE23_9HYPO|nr:hypothetical protein Triagg1_4997 [Trichoderma aggressivum f. europaeum]
MRRQPRPPVSGASFPSSSTPGRRAILSRRSRTRSRTQHHAVVNHSQIRARTRNSNSRLIAAQQRPSASSSALFHSALSSLIESTAKESRDNIIMATKSCPVPWARIKLWIEAQEKAEQQGNNPNPPTKPQLQALSHLVSFVEGPEPDVSAHDHVSLLTQHIQFHHKRDASSHLPTFEDVGLEVPINGNFHMRWRTTCSLPSASHMIFPCEGHGVSQGQQPPLFATKKASKQYAAMHALAYLRAMRPPLPTIVASTAAPAPAPSSNRVSGGVSLKAATPPVSKSPKASDSSLAMPPGDAGGAPLVQPPPPPPPSAETAAQEKPTDDLQGVSAIVDGEFYTGEVPSLLKQVAEDAKRLNFGVPKYDIEEDPNKPGSFNGKPVFVNGGRMPDDIGHVEGAMSKSVARQQIAEKLNDYFTAELKRRDGIFRSFTATPVENSSS